MMIARWQKPETATWPSLNRWFSLRNEFDRLFESPLLALGPGTEFLNGWVPAVDLYQDKDNLVARAELPGMKKEDIEVSFHNGVLTIAGERKREEKIENPETHRSERFFGRFQRSITLPAPVDGSRVKAAYKDGILTVTLPKTEEAKPKQIEVSVK